MTQEPHPDRANQTGDVNDPSAGSARHIGAPGSADATQLEGEGSLPLPAGTVLATAQPRRRALQWTVGAIAGLAGLGTAWWRLRGPVDTNAARAENAAGTADPALAALWQTSFDTPAGGSLNMATLRGKPLLLNFWATWCPPCVEELPALDLFYKTHAPNGWQVVALAIDQPSSVRKFLARTPLTFPVGLAGLGGTELSRSLGNAQDKMPFSLLIGANGSVLQRKIGQLAPADLEAWRKLS